MKLEKSNQLEFLGICINNLNEETKEGNKIVIKTDRYIVVQSKFNKK